MSAAPTTAKNRTSNAIGVQRAAISRTALIAAWVLLVIGIALWFFGQPLVGALALLGAIAASVASLDGATRVRWATIAVAVLALAALIVVDAV